MKAGGFPLFLAPMAGVTNTIFRQLCQQRGADVLTSEFVSAEGIFHRNERTREYLEFAPNERPVGVQLFGGNPEHLAEAARQVVDWVHPDFIDLNFGCPVNKVVCKQGGSALLKDCPLLERVAVAVVNAVAPIPVTAKIRIGWSATTVNATTTARILENAGITRLAVHGRTKEQGYSGQANWDVIAEVAECVSIPVIGNGDISCAEDALRHRRETRVSGLMIGRAAMTNPWIFTEIKAAMDGADDYRHPTLADRWALVAEHCRLEAGRRGDERRAMHSMRSRLMAYSRGMPQGRHLRERFSQVESVAEVEDIASAHLAETAGS
ncbi:MAG TPA: tRNA dihydrouridine synthase DusB [Chthoniobacterales bacterium]|nr:tRNA dihydrouridine synthase DusB [Chthoniobacterales bacterium]